MYMAHDRRWHTTEDCNVYEAGCDGYKGVAKAHAASRVQQSFPMIGNKKAVRARGWYDCLIF